MKEKQKKSLWPFLNFYNGFITEGKKTYSTIDFFEVHNETAKILRPRNYSLLSIILGGFQQVFKKKKHTFLLKL